MNDWTVIHHNVYWDVPRAFVVRHGEEAYYFESEFNEALDDYTPHFHVYRIKIAVADAPASRWGKFRQCERLPDILVNQLRFQSKPIPGYPAGMSLHFIHDSVFEILERTCSAA